MKDEREATNTEGKKGRAREREREKMEAGMEGKRRGDKRSSGSVSSSDVSTKFSFTASTNTPSSINSTGWGGG